MSTWTPIEQLCDRHLGGRPSAAALAQIKKAEGKRAEVRAFLERAFRLMELSRVRAADIAPNQAWALGTLIAGFLPDAWGGSIPPFTWEHRHKRIDAYLASNRWMGPSAGTHFLEIACGFPPKTAIDVARAHPDWHVIGADPCFDEYLLTDERGNYACLNSEGSIRYFHSAEGNAAELFALHQDKAATLRRFTALFEKLRTKLSSSIGGTSVRVQEDGASLVRHPVRLYETANLMLEQKGIGAEFARCDIIRCFNVLGYFDTQFRRQTEQWALRTLNEGGLFICGRDGAATTEAAYSIYRREDGVLVWKEFAVSIDALRNFTIGPWFSMHEGDGEVWREAKLVGLVREDAEFRSAYDARVDELLTEKRLFVRDAQGYLTAAPDQLPPSEWIAAQEDMLLTLQREGFAERAVQVLGKRGLRAWVNEIGDVSVDPAGLAAA